MKRSEVLWIVLIGILMGACIRELDIPFPEHQPRLTLNSFLVEGKQPFLYLSRSFGAVEEFEEDDILVKGASVGLWQRGKKIVDLKFVDTTVVDTFDQFEVEDGSIEYYTRILDYGVYLPLGEAAPLEAMETYEFKATHPLFGEASSQVIVVPRPEILGIQIVKDSIITRDFTDGYQDKWTALKIQIKDPGEIANYFNFSTRVKYLNGFKPGFSDQDTSYLEEIVATEIERDAGGVVYPSNSSILDAEFDGQFTTLVVFIRLPGCCGYTEDFTREDDYTYFSVEVTTFILDANYGRFQKKRELQRYNRSEGLEGALFPTEPVVVSGNVEGGYGLVGSFNLERWEVDLSD